MRIAVVDDEESWRIIVEALIKSYPWEEDVEIETFNSGEAFYRQEGFDVVFMDIEMGKMDGFEAARKYKEKNEEAIIIFLTTHTELSRRGYLVNALRYIDKCQIDEEMEEAFVAITNLRDREHELQFRVVCVGEISLKIKEILYFETVGRNVVIRTSGDDYTTNCQMEELEKELAPWGFFRCHKSYLVNLGNVLDYSKKDVYFKKGKYAMVSARKYSEFKEKYMEYKHKHANS